MSEECIKSELDLFTVPMTQTAIEKNTYVEIPPLSAITDSSPLEFFNAGTGEDYIDLYNTLLYTRIKITRPDGSDIADGAPVGLINYPGACIFSQVDVSLGDRLITQSSSTYPYRCLIEALINFTNASNVIELLAPIHSDIFFQEKFMLNGVDIKIRMTRGKDEFCLMRDDAIAYKIYIMYRLCIHFVNMYA